jgi:hypothetical protein
LRHIEAKADGRCTTHRLDQRAERVNQQQSVSKRRDRLPNIVGNDSHALKRIENQRQRKQSDQQQVNANRGVACLGRPDRNGDAQPGEHNRGARRHEKGCQQGFGGDAAH